MKRSILDRLESLECQQEAEPTYPMLFMPPVLPIEDGPGKMGCVTEATLFLTALEHCHLSDADVLVKLAAVPLIDMSEIRCFSSGVYTSSFHDPTKQPLEWYVSEVRSLPPIGVENRIRLCRFQLDYLARHGTRCDRIDAKYDWGHGLYMYEPSDGWEIPDVHRAL